MAPEGLKNLGGRSFFNGKTARDTYIQQLHYDESSRKREGTNSTGLDAPAATTTSTSTSTSTTAAATTSSTAATT